MSQPSTTTEAAASAPPAATGASAKRECVVIDATGTRRDGAVLTVAGLSVVERLARQAVRHGAKRVIVVVESETAIPALRLPRHAELRQVGDAAGVQAIAEQLGAEVIPADVLRPGKGPSIRVTDGSSARRAEKAIFAELLRGDLGLVARHINKPISFRITRHLLCHLPVTPNQVTVVAGLIGLLGAVLIATGSYAAVVAGFALAQLQSILDGCDGELARVRFQQSAIGEWLDTVVDDFLNLALLVALGVALRHPERSSLPVDSAVAFVSAAMMLFYNVVAYRELVKQGEGGEVLKVRWWFARGQDMKSVARRRSTGPSTWLYAMGRRDFFVLAWLVLAMFDLLPVVAVYALFIALTSFVGAVGQLVWTFTRRRAPSPRD